MGKPAGDTTEPSHLATPGPADGEAIDQLYRRVWDRAFETACGFVPEFDASDAAQQAALIFVRLWRAGRIDKTDDRLVEIWATRAARHRCLKLISAADRREEREFSLEDDDIDIEARDQVPSPAEQCDARELAEVMRRAVIALPRRRREVFLAVRDDRERPIAIAKRLNLSVETVRRHYKMAVARLRAAAHAYVTEGLIPENQ